MTIQAVSNTNRIQNYQNAQRGGAKPAAPAASAKDEVAFSEEAKIFHTALLEVRGQADIDTQKVAEARGRIGSGNYRVAAADLAEAMIKRAVFLK